MKLHQDVFDWIKGNSSLSEEEIDLLISTIDVHGNSVCVKDGVLYRSEYTGSFDKPETYTPYTVEELIDLACDFNYERKQELTESLEDLISVIVEHSQEEKVLRDLFKKYTLKALENQ